jgi:hypothetical protein
VTVSWAGSGDVRAQVSGGALEAASQSFATLVGDFRTATIVMNIPVGRMALEMFQLRLVKYPDMLMVPQIVERECR